MTRVERVGYFAVVFMLTTAIAPALRGGAMWGWPW